MNKLTYQDCKELRDAGYPHPEEPTTGDYSSWTIQHTYGEAFAEYNGETYLVRIFPGVTYARSLLYRPTLEELIDTCGGDFQDLKRNRAGNWDAFGHKSYGKAFIGGTKESAIQAVKALYIILYAK